MLCLPCHYSCLTCTAAASINCNTCDPGQNRVKNTGTGACDCTVGFLDVGVMRCTDCHYSCTTCSGSGFNQCLTCNGAADRTKIVTQCPCDPKFYDDGSL